MTAPPEAVLRVDSVGVRGDGVASHNGEPVFLPFTAPGDVVRARLGERRGDGRSGAVVAFVERGVRAEPSCRHFGLCGGCALQHLTPETYAAAKLAWLAAALRQHGLAADGILPLLRLPPGTRRRARFAIHRPRSGPCEIGFHARASHRVVDMRQCDVLHPTLYALVGALRAVAPALFAPGSTGAATATLGETGIDLLLDLAAPPALAMLEAMADFAAAQDLARLHWRVAGEAPTPLAQRRPVRITFSGVAVDLPDEAFVQASAEADAALLAAVLERVGTAPRVADLFAGVGTFSFALAARATVHAVDGAAPAIEALRAAASRSGLAPRLTAERRDLEQRPLQPADLKPFDAVVFDPPRAGARAQSRALAASRVGRVVAVSCNPATFARDARTLVDGGYRMGPVQPIDSFIWSPHLELVAAFARD